ncbi:unnamed protein product [Spirodela intermedia]|uniref:WRKY domain-containing protein n=1 Tax=Spirodela intermedia TaxID=51605 RepID=A0A7I8JRS8_SPIIN|nr:unnamed protein product [Spirodela intermedia]CAA6672917.1 unnamed protein product [Spirodela intermedia]
MENGGAALSRERLIGELNQGIELTRVLETHLDYASPLEFQRLLVRSLLSTLARAVSIAMTSPSFRRCRLRQAHPVPRMKATVATKTLEPQWTQWIRVSSAAGVEAPAEDGFSWRKYGQKEILAAKFPRAYYRCSHHKTRGCPARKQVQRSDTDELLFDVIYHGVHSCGAQGQVAASGAAAVPPAAEADGENSEPRLRNEALILNFRTGLAIKPEEVDGGDGELPSPLFPLVPGEPGGASSTLAIAGPSGSGQLRVDPDFPVLEMDLGDFFSAVLDPDFMGTLWSPSNISLPPRASSVDVPIVKRTLFVQMDYVLTHYFINFFVHGDSGLIVI